MSEEEKFTKPKHRNIADVYAKRIDDSVSIQNAHTDPAGLNFNMNNLNAVESDAMGETMTNYMCNIINRRNAMDFNQPNMNCGPYGSSCADNNSEISVSVRHFRSIESQRNSIDSQVSQVQMSETKMTFENHSRKHKMKAKKRQRNYLYARRGSRRASSSSIESQQITNQMICNRYPVYGRSNSSRPIANTCTKADINELLNRNNLQEITNGSDDDKSFEESTTMQITTEPSNNNMLAALGSHHHRHMADSSLNMPNDMSHEKQAVIEQVLKSILKNSTEQEIEQLLNSYERNGNGQNSIRNSKTQRNSHSKVYANQKDERFSSEITSDIDLATSISSSMNIDLIPPLDGTQSSFSDQSVNRLKTQSQNSKRSCDVGIQANDYDISSHTRQKSRENGLCEKLQPNYHNQDNDYTETHQLLPFRKRDAPNIVRKDTMTSKHLSESERAEKLRELLMPSN